MHSFLDIREDFSNTTLLAKFLILIVNIRKIGGFAKKDSLKSKKGVYFFIFVVSITNLYYL